MAQRRARSRKSVGLSASFVCTCLSVLRIVFIIDFLNVREFEHKNE